jgi:hypothetical protein
MINIANKKFEIDFRRLLPIVAIIGLALSFALPAAATPNTVSLNIDDSRPGQTTSYTLTLSGIANTATGCVTVDLESPDDDASGALYDASSTAFTTASSWADDSTTSQLKITNASPTAPDLTTAATLVWTGVDNGTTADTAYDATYTAYSDTSCSTPIANETITIQYIFTTGQDVSATIDPSFTFTVAGLADAVSVNGTPTTIDASASPNEIPFGTVTTGANSVVGQSLTINTNAQNGYNIYVQYTDNLENAGDTYQINDFAGPGAFSSAGTENFGFTTEDTDVLSAGQWDGLTTAQQVIANETSVLSTADVTEVAYQLGVESGTPAGEYDTIVIYTAVPTY